MEEDQTLDGELTKQSADDVLQTSTLETYNFIDHVTTINSI